MPPKPSGKQDAKPLNRSGSNQFNKRKPFQRASTRSARPALPAGTGGTGTDEPKILFQTFFKSVGPRTYAAQIKEAKNGNYFIVLTEGQRDRETDEVKKIRLFVYSEDFKEFFKLLGDTAQFLREHPVPEEIRARRQRYWAKQNGERRPPSSANGREVKPPPLPVRGRTQENRNRR